MTTRFTTLVGCTVPIQQAGMGALSPPELAAAVSETGAFGMLGTARNGLNCTTLRMMLDRLGALTRRPFGVNFIVAPTHRRNPDLLACIEMAARAARVVEFFYGEPDPALVSLAHAGGALAAWQVGSRQEAVAAREAGCDFVVAQGMQAGGHVRGTIGMLALLEEVLDAVDVPVVAAGGIGSGRAMAAALAAGADGVRVGTRFVAAVEAGAHPAYAAALIAARAEDTVYTSAFSANWPDAPHRVLKSCVSAAEAFEGDTVGHMINLAGERYAIRRFASGAIDTSATGAIEAMSLWAGESVGAVKRVQPAAEIVRELVDEAAAALARAASQVTAARMRPT
jgi:NAD(P)H-dependent flavin oxidoreductase YrpB (nitropropane dioxygenase family)